MHHIVYMSQATDHLTPITLVTLLMQARTLNERQHVTGALVYGHGQFMQVIEGEEAVVKNLYERIARDPRSAISRLRIAALPNGRWHLGKRGPTSLKNCKGWLGICRQSS
jgi:hypothetical protein